MSGTTLNRTLVISDRDCEHIGPLFGIDPRTIRRLFGGQRCWILIRHFSKSVKTPKTRASEKRRRKARKSEVTEE